MADESKTHAQTLVIGNRDLIDQQPHIWQYQFQEVFIGPLKDEANCIALCNGPIMEADNLDLYPVKTGGLFSWMVPSPLSKLVARLPVSKAIGIPLDKFYADNRPLCPRKEQLADFLDSGQDAPCFMLNFFKYRSLWRILAYGMSAARHQYSLGSEMVWSARCLHPDWEEVAIFRYPSRRAFIEMLSRKNYQKAEVRHREKGWADTKLIVMTKAISPIAKTPV